jgi:hypothetical protein
MSKPKEQKITFKDAVGTPTVMMLPARNYKFKVSDKDYSVTIPRHGKYADLDNQMFSEEDGEFNLMQYSRKDKAHIIYLPTLTKVLFATSQYPDLENTQAFTPIALIIKKDTVDIIGNLIEMVKED